LILDGVEPLQNPPGVEQGRIKDQGLCCLLRELAYGNPGLCVMTTRLKVVDLQEFAKGSVVHYDLEDLSPEAGAQLLESLGVSGTNDELEQAARDFRGHALALTLLGKYLVAVEDGDIRKRNSIPTLIDPTLQGACARRIMESYEKWLETRPELDILRIMALFDRPAEAGAIEAVMQKPAIKGLTRKLQKMSDEEWQLALRLLRDDGLLAPENPLRPDTLDCHPLIREHFADKLKVNNSAAWKEAHSRLYEYYKSIAKEYPDTIEEMAPLYDAVAHGCQAGRYQEAFNEVYWKQISRADKHFSTRKLGAFGADLAVLSGFFDPPWSKPVAGLSESAKSFLLNTASFRLQALGRLSEAAQPMEAGLEAALHSEHWKNAAIAAGNLSELFLTMGDMSKAVEYAQEGMKLADRSGDEFMRMGTLTFLADSLHQTGRISESEAAFFEAEKIQKKWQPGFPLLYSFPGDRYCDLLLTQGKSREIQKRADQTLRWAEEYDLGLLAVALDILSLGRGYLLQAVQEKTGDFTQGTTNLNEAVDGLRKAGMQHELPRGLLARAELYRVTKDFKKAQKDIDEAMTIATRGQMHLHECDCHLEQARLYLAQGKKDDARPHFEKARDMVNEMGYHRRDQEVTELEKQLAQR
jgi:tetratricopeptide (TPR) repeat protein